MVYGVIGNFTNFLTATREAHSKEFNSIIASLSEIGITYDSPNSDRSAG